MNEPKRGVLTTTSELISREQRIHGPRTETLQIKRDELEPQRFEYPGKFNCHLGSQGAAQFFARNFDADDVTVMANTKLAEAEFAQCVLALFDDIQNFPSNRTPVFDSRRQARRCRLFPNAQARITGEFPNFLFG